MRNRISALVLICFLLISLLPISVYAQPEAVMNPFSDVTEGNRFYDAIMWAYTTGVTTGKTSSTFLPSGTCTRAQVVTFLWRAAGEPQPSSMENPFSDVKEGSYYFKAVMWAVEKGITTGKTATTFEPDEPVQRKQFVTFLWRAAGKPEAKTESPFTDVPRSNAYFYRAVVWACENGITGGIGNGLFGVDGTCTRAQTVMFLYRYHENKPTTTPCGIILSATELLSISEPVQLKGTVLPLCADPSTITWSSSDTAIAAVSQDGVITPIGTGNAVITAKCGSATARCTVSCEMQPASADGLDQQLQALMQQTQQLEQQISDMDVRLETIETDSGALQAGLTALEQDTSDISAALDSLALDNEALDTQVRVLRDETALLHDQITETTQNITSLDTRIYALEQAVSELQGQETATQQAIRSLTDQFSTLQSEVDAMQTALSAMDENMTAIHDRIDYLSGIIAGLMTRVNALDKNTLLQNAEIESIKKMLGCVLESSTVSEAFLSEKGYLSSITGKSQYYVVSYPVKAGVTYRLSGKGVRLNSSATALAVFSKSNEPGSGGRSVYDSIIIGCDQYDLSVAADYDVSFTASYDGYLLVAHYAGYNSLDVEVAGNYDTEKPSATIQIFGDSMSDNTWGDMRTWVDLLPGLLPDYDLTIHNSAVAGNTLTEFVRLDGTSSGVAHQILSDPSELDPDADLIIIWAGSNDWTSIYSLGSMLDGDSSTVYGAVQNIIGYVSENSDAQLLFITPVQRNSEGDRQYRTETDMYGNRLNERSYTLEQFSEAIRETCAYYAIPCLDLYHTSGINQDNILGKYSNDGLHVNEAGEQLLAAQIAEMILHPTSTGAPTSLIPAYDLSTYTDVFKDALFETIVVDGSRVWLNRYHSGIKHAFSKGAVKLSYKLEINGETITVESISTASYIKESDTWYFSDTIEYEDVTIRVTMKFEDYGMEARAFTIEY